MRWSRRASAVAALSLLLVGGPAFTPDGASRRAVGQLTKTVGGRVWLNDREVRVGRPRALYAGSRIRTDLQADAAMRIELKRSTCSLTNRGSLVVRPRQNKYVKTKDPILVDVKIGTLACGSQDLRGKVFISTAHGAVQTQDPVVTVIATKERTTVQVTRGAVIVEGSGGRDDGVVLGLRQQTTLRPGANPGQPARALISSANRRVARGLERQLNLPPVAPRPAPTVRIETRPPEEAAATSATFGFRAFGPGGALPARDVTFACEVDHGGFHPCVSPVTLTELAIGAQHTFSVKALDLVGRIGAVATDTWRIRPSRIAFISGRDGNAEIYAMNADGGRQMRLTATPGAEGAPEWAPDGSRLAFHADRDGNTDVYTMDADGTDVRRHTTGREREGNPAWSPDGTRIAFERGDFGRRDLYVLRLDGGAETRVTDHPADDSDPTWSPSGDRLAFTSDRDPAGSAEIFTARADGTGEPVNVTKHPAPDANPSWSRLGRIVFHSKRDESDPRAPREGNDFDIYAVREDGSELAALTRNAVRDQNPAWAPDGTSAVFQGEERGSLDEIYVVGADQGGAEREDTQRLSRSEPSDLVPSWAWGVDPGGDPRTAVAFVSGRDGNSEIYSMNSDGAGQTRLTVHPSEDRAPAWSPDRRRIAFDSTRTGAIDLYTMSADGRDVTRLTDELTEDRNPTWSPDGRRIAYEQGSLGGREIATTTLATSVTTTAVTDPGADDFDPAWSPDGSRIAFATTRVAPALLGRPEVVVVDAAGSGERRSISGSDGDDFGPAWSPLGELAFCTSRDGDFDLWLANADATGRRPLTVNDVDDQNPAWSGDGASLVFQTTRDGDSEIYSVRRDGTLPTRLTHSLPGDIHPNW